MSLSDSSCMLACVCAVCVCACVLEKKRQIVRLEVKSSQNVNDPTVKKEILAKVCKLNM